jgi:hypothetical protein
VKLTMTKGEGLDHKMEAVGGDWVFMVLDLGI